MRPSVILPLYNKAHTIRRAIRSLARQTRRPAEIIVIDDASTDGSLRALQQALRDHAAALAGVDVHVVPLPQNRGVSHARNTGLGRVTGDHVTMLDADDEYTERFFEHAADVVEDHDPDIVFLTATFVPSGMRCPDLEDVEGPIERLDLQLSRILDPLRAITGREFFAGPSVLCRAELLRDVRYDEGSSFFEGIDFWYRALRAGLARRPLRCLLDTGDYLRMHEVPGSLSRHRYPTLEAVLFPGILERLADSDDLFDQRLWTMIAGRFWPDALRRLDSPGARAAFALRTRGMVRRYLKLRARLAIVDRG